jgi:putative addiction module component (TIGR02574 family)
MTQAAEEILQKALELPEEDRDRIADSLWRSVHGVGDESVEEAWTAETERRIAELDQGKVQTRPWSETLDKLQARLSR